MLRRPEKNKGRDKNNAKKEGFSAEPGSRPLVSNQSTMTPPTIILLACFRPFIFAFSSFCRFVVVISFFVLPSAIALHGMFMFPSHLMSRLGNITQLGPVSRLLQDSVALAGQPLDALLLPIVQIPPSKSVVFLLHVHLPSRPPYIQLLVLGQLPHFAIVLLISNRRRGREDKRASHNDGDKGQAKGEERMFAYEGSILHADLARVGRRAECLVLERRHRDCD